MKLLRLSGITLVLMLVAVSALAASDFDWTRSFSLEARADSSGFKAQLKSRFKIGDVQLDALLSYVNDPADAYLLLRLGEISERPIELVIEKYRRNNGKGWGEVAKSLGIKPGSRQFHALKQGHDLNNDTRLVHGKVLSGSYAVGNQEYAGKDGRRGREKRQK